MVRKPVNGFSIVPSDSKPWVANKKYQTWLRRLRTHTKKRDYHDPEDLCDASDNMCKGDLGIPRNLMPQFNTPADIKAYAGFIKTKYGIRSRRQTRKAKQLRPSQEEINIDRVEDVVEKIEDKKVDPNVPLIVSKDNYVIDGHHRWAAYKTRHPNKQLPVLVIQAPARDVIGSAITWGAKHQEF